MQVSHITATAIILAAATFHTMPVQAEEQFENWYQIDVILFKPKTTDLDEESWPQAEGVYPANVTSVTRGEVFKLSQLEQLQELLPEASPDAVPELGRNDFAFEGLGNQNRNRRVIERATGLTSELPAGASSQAIPTDAESRIPGAASVEDIINAALAQGSPNTGGALAFSDRAADSSLQAISRSLGRSSRYTVLSHLSWVQPIGVELTPILVQAGQRYDDRFEVEGTLSFSLSRFLHIQTNLWYTIFEPRGGNPNPYLTGFQSNLSDEMLEQHPALVEVERERGQYYPARTHLMFQSRRMRSDELHYIDHPLFGVIVRINRFKPKAG